MTGPKPKGVDVNYIERPRLEAAVSGWTGPVGFVRRCQMILLLADGHRPTEIGRTLGCSDRVVRKWRARWLESPRVESLYDADRPGRPPRISLATRCHVVQLACNPPAEEVAPSRCVWTQQELADALHRSRGDRISRSTVQRILSAEGLRPHRVRQWLHSPDPDFTEKVERVCSLYLDPPDDALVLCVDEKPMQALKRRYPSHVAAGGFVRHEYEYRRGGVCHLLASFDTRTGRVISKVVEKRTAAALLSFMRRVAQRHPNRRIIIVWDNLNIHLDGKDERWTRFNAEQGGRFEFVHTPLHASWLNQIEIWFSILHRRVLRHGSFDGIASLRSTVLGFAKYWNRHARPFRWTFSGNFVQTPDQLAA